MSVDNVILNVTLYIRLQFTVTLKSGTSAELVGGETKDCCAVQSKRGQVDILYLSRPGLLMMYQALLINSAARLQGITSGLGLGPRSKTGFWLEHRLVATDRFGKSCCQPLTSLGVWGMPVWELPHLQISVITQPSTWKLLIITYLCK